MGKDYFNVMKVYVIMVALNNLKYTRQTLDSFKTDVPHEFIILDNASIDGTPSFLDAWTLKSRHSIILYKMRVCVAKAWNDCLKRALADPEFQYAYIINNDIIFEPYCLDALVKFVEQHPEYKLLSGVNTRDYQKEEGKLGENLCDFSAFLLTRTCIEKIGLFDENFEEAYFEDNDYHQRVYRAGLKSCVVRGVGMFHIGSRTLAEGLTPFEKGMHDALFRRNREYFLEKWGFVP
jgi:GT2 family glycosyltransferase